VKKSWLLLAGAAVGLTSCVISGNVEVFSAFNLKAPKVACTVTGTPPNDKRELNLSFNYAGTLRGVKLTFTPNGKPSVVANIADLSAPPAGLRIDTLTAGEARLFIDLSQLTTAPVTPTSLETQDVPKPIEQRIYPMDIDAEAIGKTADAKIKLNSLTNVNVENCYAPDPIPAGN
jgi:hypothetical protein